MAVKQDLPKVDVRGLPSHSFVKCNDIHIPMHKKKLFMI